MMNQNLKKTAHRAFAALLSVLMLLSQLVLPAAAFAAVDVSTLPMLTVGYTDLDGELCTLSVAPAATGANMDEVVYWAQLPGNANWETPVTLTAVSQDGNVCLPDGTTAYPGVNATEKDGSSYTGWVEIYTPEEMKLIATYPVYLSTLPLPEEPEPVFASVTVHYINAADNSVLLSDTKSDLAPGEYWFSPDRAGEISGFDLVSSDAQMVTVYADGTTSGDVYFQLQARPVYGSVNIYYINAADNSILLSDIKGELAPGEYSFTPDRAGEISGFDLVSSDAQSVTIGADGTASNDIYFQLQARPVYGSVNIYYINAADNSILLSDFKGELAPGEYSFTPDRAGEIGGYQLVSSEAQTVTIGADGVASGDVYFRMEVIPAAPVYGSVNIYYINAADNSILLSDTKSDLAPGEYSFTPDRAGEIGGYQLISSEAQTVTIGADGVASGDVYFRMQVVPAAEPEMSESINRNGTTNAKGLNIRKAPKKASGNEVGSISNSGSTVFVHGLVVNDAGESWYKITYNGVDGYVMASYVDLVTNGGDVYVSYITAEGEFAGETVTVSDSSNVISPNPAKVPEGYTAVSAEPVTITFNESGKPTLEKVEFTYAAPAPVEKSGTVTVKYTCDGAILHEETVNVSESSNVVNADSSKVAAGYTLTSAASATITFGTDGTPSPAVVEFTYAAPAPVEKSGMVNVRYTSGSQVLYEENVTVTESSNIINADYSKVPAGYTPVSVSPVTVTFDGSGNPTPASVEFTFDAPKPAEKSGKVTVVYMAGRTELANEVVLVSESNNVISPNAALVPKNYTAIKAEAVTIGFDANGNPDPARVEFTYQAPEKTGQVSVSYVSQRGEFYKQTVAVSESNNVVSPNTASVPAGYTAVSVAPVTVSFDANGAPVPASITFVYQAPALSGSVMVQYVNAASGAAFNGEVIAVSEGTTTIRPNAAMIPTGYTAVSAEPVQVTLGTDGVVTPDMITFTYQAPPITGTVDVLYVTAEQGTFASETVTLAQGENTISPNKNLLPDGYTPVKADAVTVTLNADGTTQPSSVAFVYQAPAAPAVKASVTFKFVDEGGKALLDSQTVELEDGIHDPAEYAAKLDGYTCQGPNAALIRVSGGAADPATVTFTYAKNKTAAKVEIHYLDTIGKDLGASPEVVELGVGTHTIQPNTAYIPAGYSLGSGSAQSYTVTVNEDLTAQPASVSFTLVHNSVMGRVNVLYLDVSTMKPIATEVLTLRPGTHTVIRDDSKVGDNYEPAAAGVPSYEVVISDLGKADRESVSFYYQKKQAETYMGYALVSTQTNLRNAYNQADSSIVAILPVNTLVYVNGQQTVGGINWSSSQIVLGNNLASGVVLTSALQPIEREQAEAIINQYNQMQPPIAEQISGYYATLSDNVPLRAQADAQSAAKLWLAKDRVVYVSGMEYRNDNNWYLCDFEGELGYIRHDMLRRLTEEELERYLGQQNPPTVNPEITPAPYDPYGMSSYGYVNSSSVNFREEPNGTKMKVLNRYAFCLVMGTREVNGVTWYNVNQNGTLGWVHGDYFHQLNLTELTAFLNSNEYKQGLIANSGINTGDSNTSSGTSNSTGVSKPGNISSVEDWNVGAWQNTGVSVQTSYAPFNPIATATPLPSVSPSASAMVTPTPTFVIGTMIPIDYTDESKETQTATVPWGLIAAGVVLIGGAGGVYAFAMNQNRKRKAAAARAAQARRAQAAQYPNARRTPGAPGTPGAQPGAANGNARNPYMVQQAPNPYAQPSSGSPYNGGSSESRNPYGAARQTGRPADLYAPPATAEPPVNTPAEPYAPQSSAQAAMGDNPFARPITAQTETYAPPAENAAGEESAPRRRASRVDRYHDAGNGTDAEA